MRPYGPIGQKFEQQVAQPVYDQGVGAEQAKSRLHKRMPNTEFGPEAEPYLRQLDQYPHGSTPHMKAEKMVDYLMQELIRGGKSRTRGQIHDLRERLNAGDSSTKQKGSLGAHEEQLKSLQEQAQDLQDRINALRAPVK